MAALRGIASTRDMGIRNIFAVGNFGGNGNGRSGGDNEIVYF